MSNTRIKMFAAVSALELENQVNEFLQKDEVEIKDLQYQTNGYEKPYSAAILYHNK